MAQPVTTITAVRTGAPAGTGDVPAPGASIPLAPLPATPLVSILMANYNNAPFIGAAIESVLGQTYPHLELLVCDDASTDDSCEIVERYARRDPRVKLVRKPRNEGAGAALNGAFAASSGDIICLLDADDCFAPTKVETIVRAFARHPSAGIVVHPLTMVDGAGTPILQIGFQTRRERGWIVPRLIARGGRWSNMPGGGTCVRREVAEAIFPIPASLYRRYSDGFIYTLAPLLTEVLTIDDPLYHYRVHGQNTMASFTLDEAMARDEADGIAAQVNAVNDRLRDWGWGDRVLNLDRNLNYTQQRFLLTLFQGAPRLRSGLEYFTLARAFWHDDLYGPRQKVLRLGVYGVALLLPARVRRWWLIETRSRNRLRRRLWLAADRIRKVPRRLRRRP